jgi:hypothetical protein
VWEFQLELVERGDIGNAGRQYKPGDFGHVEYFGLVERFDLDTDVAELDTGVGIWWVRHHSARPPE